MVLEILSRPGAFLFFSFDIAEVISFWIIDDCQIGFTRKARTSDHMFILKCIIDQYCKTEDGKVFACSVDFQKAFDKVIHTGIKLKLLEIGVSSRFYNIIKKHVQL
jgi:hypothetical protein